MIHVGKCPRCDKTITRVIVETIGIGDFMTDRYKGVTYHCPSCNVVLGVQMDPISLRADTVNELLAKLRGR